MARCKGVLIAGLARLLAAQRTWARTRLSASTYALLDADVAPSGWYPLSVFEELLEAAGRLRLVQGSRGDVWANLGRLTARRDLLGDQLGLAPAERISTNGMYASMIRVGQPRHLLRIAPTLWSLYYDSGRLETMARGQGCGRIRLLHFASRSTWVAQAVTGYIEEATRIVAGNIDVALLRSPALGDGYFLWEVRRAGVTGVYAREAEETDSFALREMRQAVSSLRPLLAASEGDARRAVPSMRPAPLGDDGEARPVPVGTEGRDSDR